MARWVRETEFMLLAIQHIARVLRIQRFHTLRTVPAVDFVAKQLGAVALGLDRGRVLIGRAITGVAIVIAVAIAVVRTLVGFGVDQQTLLFCRGVQVFVTVDDTSDAVIHEESYAAIPNAHAQQTARAGRQAAGSKIREHATCDIR